MALAGRMPDPDVLIRNIHAQVIVYTEEERRQVEGLLEMLRKGGDPVALVYIKDGEIEVHARSKHIPDAATAEAIMREAAGKVIYSLFAGGRLRPRNEV